MKNAALAVIESWALNKHDINNTEKTFLEYTKEWVDKTNRGGIFLVNDEFYIFIRRLEISARKVLNVKLMKTYNGENLQEMLLIEFERNTLIDLSWCNLTSCIENVELSTKIQRQVFQKWINIRRNAFVKAWVDILKLKHIEQLKKKTISKKTAAKVDNKGTPALRKTLK